MANRKTNEEQVRKQPGALVKKIVAEIVKKDAVDVHFEMEADNEWAVIKTHDYDDDSEMSLRLLAQDQWVLQFGYYDEDDDFNEILQPLAQAEVELIPKGLQKVMLKVLASEDGLRVPGNILGK